MPLPAAQPDDPALGVNSELEAECVILVEHFDDVTHHAPSLLLWSLDFFEAMVSGGPAEPVRPCVLVAGPAGAQLIMS